jgi:hypothetical protein
MVVESVIRKSPSINTGTSIRKLPSVKFASMAVLSPIPAFLGVSDLNGIFFSRSAMRTFCAYELTG